jgi:dimethylamine/trimethylamine dehydrogenase
VKSAEWTVETASARFADSGAQEPINSFVKPLTGKPVVGVGRFTSPDEMVSQVKRGVLDLVGAARPTIADPFLPRKINEGREDEIRECIGCNICVSAYHDAVPVRCTQNPTMGEEWRRGWHPERIPPGDSSQSVLVVGAGPAGLECALALGRRGFAVTLAEARQQLGGRVTIESGLPGLSTWARVRDYRVNLLQAMGNVDIYRGSELSARDVVDFGCDHVVIATGALWTTELLSPSRYPVPGIQDNNVLTPDDVFAGAEIADTVVIYDFDHYYMGSCLAEMLRRQGKDVTIVTPAAAVSAWTFMNNESVYIRERMFELGVELQLEQFVTDFADGRVGTRSIYKAGPSQELRCGSLIVVGNRIGNDALYRELRDSGDIHSVRSIGDCRAPGAIVHAVYGGHECARTIDSSDTSPPFLRERPA